MVYLVPSYVSTSGVGLHEHGNRFYIVCLCRTSLMLSKIILDSHSRSFSSSTVATRILFIDEISFFFEKSFMYFLIRAHHSLSTSILRLVFFLATLNISFVS